MMGRLFRHLRFSMAGVPGVLLLALALGYALLFMHLSGGGVGNLFNRSPYHRLQVEALLHGRFSLADSVYQIALDLGWHDGQIQQVWGLGVSLWLAPFEALYRCFGGEIFPDRLALGLAVFLYAWYALHTALGLGRYVKRRGLGLLLAGLLLFSPPFWILALAPQLIYEETILYACLASQATLVALVRVMLYKRARDYWLCCSLSLFAALTRSTHLIYGVTAVAAASLVLWTPKMTRRLSQKARSHYKIPNPLRL